MINMILKIIFTLILFVGAVIGGIIEALDQRRRDWHEISFGVFIGFIIAILLDFILAVIWVLPASL